MAGRQLAWGVAGILVLAIAVFSLRKSGGPAPDAPRVERISPADKPATPGGADEPSTATVAFIGRARLAGAVPGEWTMDLEAAKAVAVETGLPLFLNFTGSDWCGWCQRMDRQVFRQEEWQAYAREHLLLVWLDFPQDKSLVPPELARRNAEQLRHHEVGGLPTYVLLDPDGQTRIGQLGADRNATPASFIEALDNLLLLADRSIAALRESLDDEQRRALEERIEARAMVRSQWDRWLQDHPEPTEDDLPRLHGLQEELGHAESALLQFLKSIRDETGD